MPQNEVDWPFTPFRPSCRCPLYLQRVVVKSESDDKTGLAILESVHAFYYGLLVVFGLPLLPVLDL